MYPKMYWKIVLLGKLPWAVRAIVQLPIRVRCKVPSETILIRKFSFEGYSLLFEKTDCKFWFVQLLSDVVLV